MHEIWPGWFANQPRSVNRGAPPLRLVKMKEDAYISGYEDGLRAGKKEFLKIAEGVNKCLNEHALPHTSPSTR